MNRTEMVNARAKALSKLTDMELVNTIVKYFEQNHTMPGEKALKDFAISLKGEFDGNVITGLLSQVRKDLIEEFASMVVKEVKLKNLKVVNDTKKNADSESLKASDLPMVLKDTLSIPVTRNGMKIITTAGVFELPVHTGHGCVFTAEGGKLLGSVTKGFHKNHPEMNAKDATVIATDYSNGKFANMSYIMLIDLAQNLAA